MATVMKPVSAVGTAVRWHVLISGFVSYGFDAMDFMVLALALPAITTEWHLSLAQGGLLGTAGMIGVAVSSVIIGWYSDNFGRRRALLTSVVLFGCFTAAVALAGGWWQVMGLRFMAGLGLGGLWGVVATYIAETWPAELRGRTVGFVLSSWPVGVILAAAIAGRVLPHYGWRMLFLFGAAALLAALYVLLFVPESQVWREQRQRARAHTHVAERVSVGEIFAPGLARLTLLGTAAAACALIGYWGANTWLPTYLVRDRGLGEGQMATFIIVLNIGMFAGYQIFGVLADRYGRRRALILCFIGATVLLPLYAAARDPRVLFWLGPVLGVFFAYTGPFGSYFPSLYPTRVRNLGAGFCFNVGRGIAAFAPYVLGQLGTSIGLSASIALCALGFLGAALVMLAMPEAAAQRLDD
jgi:MFS family permease